MAQLERTRSLDDAFDALSHVERRKLLGALLETNLWDDSTAVFVDASEHGTFEPVVQMERVHLPRLVEYGFIEWNHETDEIVKGPNFHDIRPLLELLVDHEDRLPGDWS